MATSAGGGGGGGGGGPNWTWSVNGFRPQPPLPPPPFFNPAALNYLSPHPPPPPPPPFTSWHDASSTNNSNNNNGASQDDHLSVDQQSLSQLLLYESHLSLPPSWGGLMVADHEEGKCSGNQVIQGKRVGLSWSDHHVQQGLMMELQAPRNVRAASSAFDMNMKRESCGSYDLYSGRGDDPHRRHHHHHHHHHHNQNHEDQFDQAAKHTWLSQMVLDNNNNNNSSNNNNVSSAANNICVTPGTNMLDFSTKHDPSRHPLPVPDRSSDECNTTGGGGTIKRARVQSACSTQQSPFKVRKEKLGDRITALHQLVSPFGKTDTASVLLEAIGYIKFLQGQIEALSLPYLGGAATATRRHQHSESENVERKKGLRSRGLCLVPVSCTLQVGSDNGADYWAPAAHGGPFNL